MHVTKKQKSCYPIDKNEHIMCFYTIKTLVSDLQKGGAEALLLYIKTNPCCVFASVVAHGLKEFFHLLIKAGGFLGHFFCGHKNILGRRAGIAGCF